MCPPRCGRIGRCDGTAVIHLRGRQRKLLRSCTQTDLPDDGQITCATFGSCLACDCVQAYETGRAQILNSYSGSIRSGASPLCARKFHFHFSEIYDFLPASRRRQRGVSRSSRTLVRDAVDVLARARRSGLDTDESKRVVLASRRRGQALRNISRGDGDYQSPDPGEIAIRRKPSRRECRLFGVPVKTCVRLFLPLHARPAGACRHSAFPAPSNSRARCFAELGHIVP
jgi:hypothetical protein